MTSHPPSVAPATTSPLRARRMSRAGHLRSGRLAPRPGDQRLGDGVVEQDHDDIQPVDAEDRDRLRDPGLIALGQADEGAGGDQGDERGAHHLEAHPARHAEEDEPAEAGLLVEAALLGDEEIQQTDEHAQVVEERSVIHTEQARQEGSQPDEVRQGDRQARPAQRHEAVLGEDVRHQGEPRQGPYAVGREGEQQQHAAEDGEQDAGGEALLSQLW